MKQLLSCKSNSRIPRAPLPLISRKKLIKQEKSAINDYDIHNIHCDDYDYLFNS